MHHCYLSFGALPQRGAQGSASRPPAPGLGEAGDGASPEGRSLPPGGGRAAARPFPGAIFGYFTFPASPLLAARPEVGGVGGWRPLPPPPS